MPTMAEIRALYPSPVPGHDHPGGYHDECYCVGGAVVMFAMTRTCEQTVADFYNADRFPEESELRGYLMDINEQLTAELAWDYACAIIAANDAGHFEEAWGELDFALTYGKETL